MIYIKFFIKHKINKRSIKKKLLRNLKYYVAVLRVLKNSKI